MLMGENEETCKRGSGRKKGGRRVWGGGRQKGGTSGGGAIPLQRLASLKNSEEKEGAAQTDGRLCTDTGLPLVWGSSRARRS
jgi:hypothetical protein